MNSPSGGASTDQFIAGVGNPDEYYDDVKEPPQSSSSLTEMASSRQGLYDRFIWPGGVIPYVIDDNIPALARFVMERVFTYLRGRTCVRWVPRTDQVDYVHITKPKGNDCWAHIGRIGGRQRVDLPNWCGYRFGEVLHEFMHTMGFHHEHKRPDSRKYVTVVWANVEKKYGYNFDVQWGYPTYGLKYDYFSVMHYSAYAFSINGLPTLIPKYVSMRTIGQRKGLSTTDIKRIRAMYRCAGPDPPPCDDSTLHPTLCRDFADWDPSLCELYSDFMMENCPFSCGVCGPRKGCHKSVQSNGAVHEDKRMTPRLCKRHCVTRHVMYAALKRGNQCVCVPWHGLGLKVDDSLCNMKCVGQQDVTCGSQEHFEVYII